MKKRSYRSEEIKSVTVSKLAGEAGAVRVFGIDVAKSKLMAAVLDGEGEVLGIVRWKHPQESRAFLDVVFGLEERGHRVAVALEPTGTYGDSLRWQLVQRGIPVYRVSPKRVRDAREVFDGAPSSHDAKAGVLIGRLHLQGLSERWEMKSEAARELRALTDQMAIHHGQEQTSLSRLEAQMARHWPELEGLVSLTSQTVVALLRDYGGPRGVAANACQAKQLMREVSRGGLAPGAIEAILEAARGTLGVRQLPAEAALVQALAAEIARQREESRLLRKRLEAQLEKLAAGQQLVAAVGVGTAAVLLSRVGDPRDFANARSWEKALGLNLCENSSGERRGRLSVSKRGSGQARAYLYLAAMRQVQHDPVVQAWYKRKVTRDGGQCMRALVAVMRKLARALWHVARGDGFDARKLFDTNRLGLAVS